MNEYKKLSANSAQETKENFHVAVNSYAAQQQQSGEKTYFLDRDAAGDAYAKLVKNAMALANRQNPGHNRAHNAFKEFEGRGGVVLNTLEEVGTKFIERAFNTAQALVKNGVPENVAIETAQNSVAGNPIFDAFGNISALSAQLYQEMALYNSFLEFGDAFNLPLENGWTGTNISRFRAPVEQVVGSAKILQGDINPAGSIRSDLNRTQINLLNDFKTAITVAAEFAITQFQRDQALGYQKAVDPALAGFILQNRYFEAHQKQIAKTLEIAMVDGQKPLASYTPNAGGEYGLLSALIQLQLADWNTATPSYAKTSDWLANPTSLVQKIQNFYAHPGTVAAPLPSSLDPAALYRDIVRLLNLYASQNINFAPKKLVLYVPPEIYPILVNIPGTTNTPPLGSFNKSLQQLITESAASGLVQNVEIRVSNMMSYRAANSFGETTSAFNYIALVAHGCEVEKKPVILPGVTSAPIVTSTRTTALDLEYVSYITTGLPFIRQYGGVFLLEFSAP